ncbi:MAG TPA: lysylphosphatidylglycerol synthase domain-containing protein, partial [Aestuariivirgaceae bacterium]|nr:lysylphosphatidylglycerol synthase domain-containing protein [Aestuariivirgaceae bacterium]
MRIGEVGWAKSQKAIGFAVAVALTALALWFVFSNVDASTLWANLQKQDGAPLVMAAISIGLQILAGGERWRITLAGLTPHLPQPPASSIHAAFYAGAFFNCFPLGNVGGDFARVMLLRNFDLPFGLKVISILVDHALALIAPIIIAALTLLAIDHPAAKLAWLAAVSILLAAGIGVYLLNFIEHVLGRWAHQRLIHV